MNNSAIFTAVYYFEPTIKSFTINLFESNTATVKDERTNCGSATLEDLEITTQIETAINDGFANATIPPLQAPWRNVFANTTGTKATIIVENGVSYASYKADNKLTLRLNIEYLLSASANDLKTIITTAVTEMNGLPVQ